MNFILDQLAADPNIAPAFRAAIKQPQFFYARLGRRRQFLSQSDADAYDAGYSSFQHLSDPPPLDRGPFGDGWFDAFGEDEEKAMASLDGLEVTEPGEFDDEVRG